MTMDTKALLAEAEALKPQLLTERRTLHRDPEVGPSLPRTAAYVTERLMSILQTPCFSCSHMVKYTNSQSPSPRIYFAF